MSRTSTGRTVSSIVLLLRLSAFLFSVNAEEEQWSFIVLADWHNAEPFARNPDNKTVWNTLYDQIHYVNQTYSGDLVLLPGDSTTGKWDTEEFAKKFRPNLTVQQRVLRAGKNCYGTMRKLFIEAGYEQILMTVGDHELGGNSWRPNSTKVNSLDEYRQGFTEGFNKIPKTGVFRFRKPIGLAPSRPMNTPFQGTSYAYRHKNVLFITLDAFVKMSDIYIDRKHGLGGEGMLTCTMEGKHLVWFESVLKEARKDDTIKHIIVQAHLPIIQPVRKVSCSGQFIDRGEESAFWKTMVKYGVDIYLAGEVHTNTVTKDPESNLLQVVSRGNSFNNFLQIKVTDDTLSILSYNEIGPKPKYNHNYEVYGDIFLNKAALCPFSGDQFPAEPSVSTRNHTNTAAQESLTFSTSANEVIIPQTQKLALISCGSGSSKICGNKPPKVVSKDARYPVRCCSDSYIDSPLTYHPSGTCPFAATCFYSYTFDNFPFSGFVKRSCPGICSGKVTHKQARKICSAVGGSICTLRDLARDCAESTGCNYGSTFVWVRRNNPTESPSANPSNFPSSLPSPFPTTSPSSIPSDSPSTFPSRSPSSIPSATPSDYPSTFPSRFPSISPSAEPTMIPRCTHITSSGVLKLLNRTSALVHLDFEKIIPLQNRQVVGMKYDNSNTLVGRSITIRGKKSKHSLPNQGSFGQPYDAQVANINIKSVNPLSYGVFNEDSRLGIYGTGPHSGGSMISHALWIKAWSTSEMILVHYGLIYGEKSQKNTYTLTLNNGTPMLYISLDAILKPEEEYDLNDGEWHHIAVSMPTESCVLSDVIIYVDGVAIRTIVQNDDYIFFNTSGRLSIGGFGYSHKAYESNFPHLSPFIGFMDEFFMWGRAIKSSDLKLVMDR